MSIEDRLDALERRIEAVEQSIANRDSSTYRAHERIDAVQDRLAAVKKRLYRVSAEQDSEIQLRCDLAGRLAAVEDQATKVGSVSVVNTARIRELTESVKALESGERDGIEDRVGLADQIVVLQERVAAYKGQVTKVKRRVSKGVCPCCNRTFENLARNMESQHPAYGGEGDGE